MTWATHVAPGSRASTLVALELDHVLIAVADLAAADRRIEARYGLRSVDGGRHPGWGTANRIVPLGATYLELIAVVDEAEAAESSFGRWVAGGHPQIARPLGWAVRTHELDAVASRLGLTVRGGSRATPDGELLQWRSGGIEEAAAEPSLPFFIQWERGAPFPGRATADHRAGAVEVARVDITGNVDRVAAWLGDHRLPIRVRAGEPAVVSIVLTGPAGDIALASARL